MVFVLLCLLSSWGRARFLGGAETESGVLDEASWATQGCAPISRSVIIIFAARRALHAGIA
jgi:hypothetical protein